MKPTVAVDTNILIRLLTRDDPDQAAKAMDLFQNHCCFIPKTVILETEWVLRFSYRFKRKDIGIALRKLMGMPVVVTEDQDAVVRALDWFIAGMDFADALHLASSRGVSAFATFDRALADKAGQVQELPIERL